MLKTYALYDVPAGFAALRLGVASDPSIAARIVLLNEWNVVRSASGEDRS